MEAAIQLIIQERERQINVLGYNQEHDTQHDGEQLVDAAMAYLTPYSGNYDIIDDEIDHVYKQSKHYRPSCWPWDADQWPQDWQNHTRLSQLVRAAALLVAEIERVLNIPNTQK